MPPATLRLARLLAVGGALLVPAAGAQAATAVSSNWAGYVVTPKSSGTKFKTVSGSWVVPKGTCTPGAGGFSATWVGIGGFRTTSKALEQTGTEFDCPANGAERYAVWYELVPDAAHPIAMTVRPGDTIDAAVTVKASRVTIYLRNRTRGTTFRRTLAMRGPDTSSTEWIVEAPSDCNSSGRCLQLPINDFGTVQFTRASVTTARGTRGSISSLGWLNTKVTLSQGGDRSGFARFASERGAEPSALAGDGSGFSVSYAEQAPPSNNPPMIAPGAGAT